MTCEYVIVWPPSDHPDDPGQRECGKLAKRRVNGLPSCDDCFAALVAENDPELIETVEKLS